MKISIIVVALIVLGALLWLAISAMSGLAEDDDYANEVDDTEHGYSPNDYAGRGLSTTHESVKRARGGR